MLKLLFHFNLEIIINIGPTTELYFLDNESYIQKGINFWRNFNLPEKLIEADLNSFVKDMENIDAIDKEND